MKTYERRKRENGVNQIDHIPTNSLHHHRSSPRSKPRTDFPLFLCSTIANPFQNQDFPGNTEEFSSLTEASPNEKNGTELDILDLPLAQWSETQNKKKGVPSNIIRTSTVEVGSAAKVESVHLLSNGNDDGLRSGKSRMLEVVPENSRTTFSSGVCPTPGSVVWAQKACKLWWPAEVLEVGSCTVLNVSTEGTDGLVLVQYYGSRESAWVNPARDLSPIEDCFEERSCNPVEEFQEALKQAIHQKEQRSSKTEVFALRGRRDCLNFVQDQSHDSRNSTNSSKTEDNSMKRGKSKRERKPIVHFDEVDTPSKSAKKVRRLRIMRSLGLAPPARSPFQQSQSVMQE